MTDDNASAAPRPEPAPEKAPRDPADTLNMALLVYIAVSAILALPILLFPSQFFDFVGVEDRVAAELDAWRWVGAMLLAWAVGAVLVLARPAGRAIFVTIGAVQLSFGAATMAYSWAAGERMGSATWHGIATLLLAAAAAVMWWARFRARRVLASG